MTNLKRFSVLLLIALIAVAAVSGQSNNSRDEMTVEQSYLQEAVEIMIIRETSRAESLDQKLLALKYIGEAIDRGNTGEEICQALETLSMEGSLNQARENGRLVNNYPLARREAAKYLGQIGTPESSKALMNILTYDREPMVLQEAIKSLGDSVGDAESDKAVDTIVFIMKRYDALNPDNMMALSTIDAFAKIAERNNGIRNPEAAAILVKIIDSGIYIKPVKDKARMVLGDLRKYNAQGQQKK